MRLLVIATLLFCTYFQNEVNAHTIADRLQNLSKGDVVVFDLHNSVAAVEVCDTHEDSIELRVVSATKDVLTRHNYASYIEWHTKGCKDAQFDEKLLVQEKKGVIGSTPIHAKWLETLFQLELFKIPHFSRRKSGPPPMSGEIDRRPIWNPPLVVFGERIKEECEAFSTKWPEDESPLSSRILILYFPKSAKTVQTFPYWIESPSSSFHVSVIDSKKVENNIKL
jgi:hypothetical protein